MSEGLLVQVGSSLFTQSAYQSEPSSQTHLSRGTGPQEEGGANPRSAYCKELLMRGGTEFSFEELRAERVNQQQLDDRPRCLKEEKKKLLVLRTSQQQVIPEGSTCQLSDFAPGVSSFPIYDESQSAAARPAGNELLDDVFLRPEERGLCLQIQYPRAGAAGPSELSQLQTGDQVQSQSFSPDSQNHNIPCADPHGGTSEDLQTVVESRPPVISHKPATKTRKKLSPIQETSVEASSVTSLGGCSPLEEGRDQGEDQDQEEGQAPGGGAVDPCDPDVRRRLLELCDVTSSPDLHSEPRPLPAVEEHSCLQLGGELYHTYSRVLDGGSFSVYKGAKEDDYVFIKVDSCSVPWDFHQFQRLKMSSSSGDDLPLISCFLFLDGCITVYTTPPDHMFTELTECVPSEVLVGRKAVGVLQLVSQLHSCRLLHAALQPHLLTCCHRGFLSSDWLFPVDWSSSVDLDLQPGVTSVQQVPSAQTYISLGLLEPNAPPQLVDLVGVAETVHLLLTNRRMVTIKDKGGWTAEKFSGEEPCVLFFRMWGRFFRSLLNAGGRSTLSVLSELKEELSTLYH